MRRFEDSRSDNTEIDADSDAMHDYFEKLQALGFIIEFDITLDDIVSITATVKNLTT